MKFNPEKCFTLPSHEQDQTRQRPYFIYGRQLDPATDYLPKPKHKQSGNHGSTTSHLPNTAKYLGVYINSKFSWNHHIDTSTLWFLNRNTAHCFRDVKECCYHTYVTPQLEYASTVWSPHTIVNINKLEMVQRNAARYVFQDFSRHSSPTSMIKELQWTSLEQRRLTARLTMMYQIQHGLTDILSHYTTRSCSHRGHPMTLHQVRCRVKPYEASLLSATVIPWNRLSASVGTASSPDSFKAYMLEAVFS